MNYWAPTLSVIVLLFAAAFFAAAETALFSLSAIERRRIDARHPRVAKIIHYLLENPRRTLIALLIGNNLVHILASAIVSVIAIHLLGDSGVGIAIAFFTVLLVVTGEIIPKTVAVRNNEALSVLTAYPLHYFAKVIMPFRRLVRAVTDWVLSLLIQDKIRPADQYSEKELQALIQIVQEEGVLDQTEGERLERLFQLEGRSVNEIMTPRTDLVAFDISENRGELARMLQQYHYTHMPVYREDLDHIVGVISTQELMLFPEKSVQELLRPSHYIPETKRIDELLLEMKKNKINFAVCVDEYGGTAGLVTLEDILEEIFGEIYDEYAKKENLSVKVGKDEFIVDGKIPIQRFNELMNADIKSEVSETLSGYILEQLGRIPKLKETFRLDRFYFEIRELERQRIAKIFVRRANP